MATLLCDVCGGENIIKEDGKFICKNCGCQYSLDEIKSMWGNLCTDKSEQSLSFSPSKNEQIASFIELGVNALSVKNYIGAYSYAKKALELDTKFSEGYLLMALARNKQLEEKISKIPQYINQKIQGFKTREKRYQKEFSNTLYNNPKEIANWITDGKISDRLNNKDFCFSISDSDARTLESYCSEIIMCCEKISAYRHCDYKTQAGYGMFSNTVSLLNFARDNFFRKMTNQNEKFYSAIIRLIYTISVSNNLSWIRDIIDKNFHDNTQVKWITTPASVIDMIIDTFTVHSGRGNAEAIRILENILTFPLLDNKIKTNVKYAIWEPLNFNDSFRLFSSTKYIFILSSNIM